MNEFDFRNPEDAPKDPGTYNVILHDVVVRPDGTIFHDVEWVDSKPCKAVLWHGPGHQSKARCEFKGPHEIHSAVYGNTHATWGGDEAFTSPFDEPPMEE